MNNEHVLWGHCAEAANGFARLNTRLMGALKDARVY